MTTDSTDFRIEIRHCIRPSFAYTWEIYSVRVLQRVKRSSRSYPTRGAAMKAGKKALLRIIAPSLGPVRFTANIATLPSVPRQLKDIPRPPNSASRDD
jgi:hypothetical protein